MAGTTCYALHGTSLCAVRQSGTWPAQQSAQDASPDVQETVPAPHRMRPEHGVATCPVLRAVGRSGCTAQPTTEC